MKSLLSGRNLQFLNMKVYICITPVPHLGGKCKKSVRHEDVKGAVSLTSSGKTILACPVAHDYQICSQTTQIAQRYCLISEVVQYLDMCLQYEFYCSKQGEIKLFLPRFSCHVCVTLHCIKYTNQQKVYLFEKKLSLVIQADQSIHASWIQR